MYVNKCTKCGAEFETKNPKRVICPNCLYPDKKNSSDAGSSGMGENNQNQPQDHSYERTNSYSSGAYSSDSYQRRDDYSYQQDRPRYDSQKSYGQGGYQRPQNNYGDRRPSRPYDRNDGYSRQGGYQRPQQGGYQRQQGGYSRPQGGYQRPQQGGYQRPQQNRFNRPQGGNRRPSGPRAPKPPKQLLVNKEQLAQIEELYKKMLPLPNPDAHEVIGEQIGLEARKVFFGINLIRQKMMLPKLAFPKRKLAVSPDQLTAIKMLYEPLLPLPPIGCHKIISAQLKIDEWRVHVGIGLIRKQLGLDRWNPDRADAPEEFKVKSDEPDTKAKSKSKKTVVESDNDVVVVSEDNQEKPVKKTRGRKKAADIVEDVVNEDE